jgi:DNA polymerase III alpha subunit
MKEVMILAPVFYVDCHNHTDQSNYRSRDCINKVEDLINYAIELGHNGVAITDHETIGGFLMAQKHYHKLIKEAKTEEEKEKLKNFRLILGNEIYLCRDGLCKENFIKGEDKYYHFILLAKDEIGNKQLRQLSTRAWSHSYESARMYRVPTYYSDLKEILLNKRKNHLMKISFKNLEINDDKNQNDLIDIILCIKNDVKKLKLMGENFNFIYKEIEERKIEFNELEKLILNVDKENNDNGENNLTSKDEDKVSFLLKNKNLLNYQNIDKIDLQIFNLSFQNKQKIFKTYNNLKELF